MTAKKDAPGIWLDMEDHLATLKQVASLLVVTATSETIEENARDVLEAIVNLLSPAVKQLTDQWREMGDALQGTREPENKAA